MRTKIIVTSADNTTREQEYNITESGWEHQQKWEILGFVWGCILEEQAKQKELERCGEMQIELRRAPGTCCPEPSCDYAGFDYSQCKECGKSCEGCVRKKG